MTSIPPEQSIADAKAEHDVDAKLREGAERARKIREAKAARGEATNLRSAVEARVAEALKDAPRSESGALERIPALPLPMTEASREILRRGMISARFQAATLDSYEPSTRAQSAALGYVRAWLERAKAGEGAMLALIGPQGTGKSHLLYGAGNALLDAGLRLYGRPWYRLADELRYGGTHPVTNRAIEAADVRAALWDFPIVLLDEVRPTASTAFDDTELAKFSCHAYDNKLAVLVTSNVWPLENVMGPAAASRYTQITIDGPDRRQFPVSVPLIGRDLATGDHREDVA